MKIQTENPALVALHDNRCMNDDYRVEFNDAGEATVRKSVGTALIEHYPGIEAAAESSHTGDDAEDSDGDEPADANDTDSDTDDDTSGSDN